MTYRPAAHGRNDRGAGLIEYALLVLFITVVGIVAIRSAGISVASVLYESAEAFNGTPAVGS